MANWLSSIPPIPFSRIVISALPRARGYKVVKLETLVDAGFINQMELKWEHVHFTRVDSEVVDNLIDKQETAETVLSKEEDGKTEIIVCRGYTFPACDG